MGWFEANNKNIFYSDETLDIAFGFIEDFYKIYKKDLRRKPTIEELEYLLNLSFGVNIDERFFSNFEKKKVESVKIKVGKCKKKMTYEVGDICAIPLKNGGYAFSRILLLEKPSWYLSEIFTYYSKNKVYHPDIEKSGNLLYPMFITPNSYDDLRVDVICRKTEGISSLLDNLYYYYGLPGHYQLVKAGKDDTGQPISDEEAKKYTKQIFHMPSEILKVIETELKKKDSSII